MPPFENKSSHNEENDNFGLFGSFEGRNGEPHAVPLVGVKVDVRIRQVNLLRHRFYEESQLISLCIIQILG